MNANFNTIILEREKNHRYWQKTNGFTNKGGISIPFFEKLQISKDLLRFKITSEHLRAYTHEAETSFYYLYRKMVKLEDV